MVTPLQLHTQSVLVMKHWIRLTYYDYYPLYYLLFKTTNLATSIRRLIVVTMLEEPGCMWSVLIGGMVSRLEIRQGSLVWEHPR